MRKTAKVLSLLLCMTILLCGCETYDNFYNTFFAKEEAPAAEVKTVKIGVFEPLSGSYAADAEGEIAGIKLANKLYPEVLDTPVELVYADNRSEVESCPDAVKELSEQGVSVILGSCRSTLSLAASDAVAEAGIPAIGVTCTNPIITDTNQYYFRVCNIESYEGDAAARFAYYHLGASQAAVLKREGDDFAQALIDTFKTRMRSCTGSEFSVTVVEYPEGTEDFGPYLFDLSTVSSGVVYFPTDPESACLVIKQAGEADYGFTWIGGSSWENIEEAVPDYSSSKVRWLDGVCYVSSVDLESVDTPTAKLFRKAFAEEYGEEAEIPESAVLGFDAYLLALEGIRSAESYTDTESIAKRLYNVYKLEGAGGSISLNSKGDPIKEVPVKKVGAKGHETVYMVVPQWGD